MDVPVESRDVPVESRDVPVESMDVAVESMDVAVESRGGTVEAWCDRCGQALADGGHSGCVAARELEPPRYCGLCRRRMKVQVLPAGWRASCVEHGTRASS